MTKKILPIFFLIIFLISSCSKSEPQSDFNVETAVAEMQEGVTVETAVAEMNLTLTAQAGGASAPEAPTTIPVTNTPAPTPTPSICFINQPCQTSGISLTVNSLQETDQIGRHFTAPDGYKYLVAEVTIKNIERDSSPFYSSWFTIVDSNNVAYVAKTFSPSPEITNGSLAKGGSITGNIAFEIPSDAEIEILTYQPVEAFTEYNVITIDISS